jgi:signal transduction histidine kinase
MMTELRPPILDERGLEAALRDHVKSMEPDVVLRFSVEADDLASRLSPAQEILLYRVAQEAMSNLVKHSQAEHAWVKLQERSGRILLEVRDDGVGFDTTHAAESGRAGHFGILGMRERVELAGGIFELDSVQGGGTLVRAYLPRER